MEVIPKNISSHSQWQSKLAPLGLVMLVAALYFETIHALFVRWIKWDEGLSHGLVIVGLFLYFLFLASPLEAKKDTFLIRLLSLVLLGVSSFSWYIANLINIYIIEQLSLLLIIIFLFFSLFGLNSVRQHFMLLFLPIFAIPIWDQLSDLLVNLSGFIVGKMVRAIDLPAVIDNNSIFIPFGEIVIADGCSGLRYLTISLAIAYVISFLNAYSIKKLAIALCIATAIGLFANWLRIFILVIVGYQSQMQSSLMSDHEYFGWALFALILFPAIYFAPVVKQQKKNFTPSPALHLSLIPFFLLLIGPGLNWILNIEPKPVVIDSQIPHEFTPITRSKMPLKIESALADKVENAVDKNGVFIEINHFQRKTKEEKLVPYIQRLYDHVAWSPISNKTLENGVEMKVFRNKHSGKFVAQQQWFQVGNLRSNHYPIAKLLQIPAIINGHNSFRIYTLQSFCNTSSCEPEISHITNVAKIYLPLAKEL